MIENASYNILILDDDQELLDLFKKFFLNHGYTVFSARDGEEGLFILEQYPVDIILCDILMPNLNGIDFIRRVRRSGYDVEIILISGRPSLDNCIDDLDHYVCDYLAKPIRRENILNSVERARDIVIKKRISF